MKYAFVRFVEHHGKGHGGDMTCFNMASGEAAESHEAFINWFAPAVPVTVLNWFEVPESWENLVASGSMNDAFEALLGLDALNDDGPIVSDLLTTIFAEGFKCGESHHLNVRK